MSLINFTNGLRKFLKLFENFSTLKNPLIAEVSVCQRDIR